MDWGMKEKSVSIRVHKAKKSLISNSGFELTFQSCIAKNYKISLVLVSPKCAPCLRLRDRKCRNCAYYML